MSNKMKRLIGILLAATGTLIVVFPVYNEIKQTDITLPEYILDFLRTLISFLDKMLPLVFRLVGYFLGIALFGYLLFILLRYFSGDPVPMYNFRNRLRGYHEQARVRKSSYSALQPGVRELNELIKYSKRRKEIEEEISRLTAELTNTDIADFYDLNRLVISGQSQSVGNGAIDYRAFLEQFGINPDKVTVRKNYAVFLTPFDGSGEPIFAVCQTTLNKLGILLQMTDNSVKKNDIMMNIVSKIVEARFVIVNIDGRNPNVYYELGIAHAIGKPTILISNSHFPESELGFDVRQKNMILYKNALDLERELLYYINQFHLSE